MGCPPITSHAFTQIPTTDHLFRRVPFAGLFCSIHWKYFPSSPSPINNVHPEASRSPGPDTMRATGLLDKHTACFSHLALVVLFFFSGESARVCSGTNHERGQQ